MNISMNSPIQRRLPCIALLMTALAGIADRAGAQSDPSPWRFGVTLGGGALVGVIAEYWSDDIGLETRLATVAFQDVSVRLSPKWRVGTWEGGEASWRFGVQWLKAPGTSVLFALHGVELARVADGGHVIGGSYNLPLFGAFTLGSLGDPEDAGDPDDAEDPDDPENPGPASIGWGDTLGAGTAISVLFTFFLGEFTYRYQPQSGS